MHSITKIQIPWYLEHEIMKLIKESCSLLARFYLILPVYIGTKQNASTWKDSFSGAKIARIAAPNKMIPTVLA